MVKGFKNDKDIKQRSIIYFIEENNASIEEILNLIIIIQIKTVKTQ